MSTALCIPDKRPKNLARSPLLVGSNGRPLSGIGLTRERWSCTGLVEQARHEHASDEYKDRYIIIVLW